MNLLKSVLLLSTAATIIQAQASPRSDTRCGFLMGKIYCFGGFLYTSTKERSLDNVINVLDLTNATGKTASELQSQWRAVSSNTNGVDITARQDPQAMELGDGKSMFLNGGFYPSGGHLADQTIVYNAETNSWSKYNAYTEDPYGIRQIYYGSILQVPGKGLALYGGFEQTINGSWTTPSTNVTVFNFSGNSSRTIGFTEVTYFNIANTNQMWSQSLPLTTWVTSFIARHASVYDYINNQILFIGGETRPNTVDNYAISSTRFPLSTAWAFNTTDSTWKTITLTGDVPSGGRFYHTLTLIPKTRRDVVMYGGESSDGVANDYCFTLNLDTKAWKRLTIDAPAGTTLARTQHSAVLTTNDTLLIMWGADGNQAGTSSILILNVSDPYAITLSDKYYDPNASSTSSSGSSNATTPSGNDSTGASSGAGLSSGAKAGIAVGCIAAAGLIAAYSFRRHRAKAKKELNSEGIALGPQSQGGSNGNHQDVIPMEVDWDRIEEKYVEMPPKTFVEYHAPNTMSPETTKSTLSGPTATDNRANYSPGLNYDIVGAPIVNPSSIETSNVYTERQHAPMILKPDGGNTA
ncbi:uncharacterized protein B0P05DRAFT_522815 [Gilbertella persicaria]|uniref:uncharacterized protein n=1 Tax=Gilbertella persicaria TaxID=101096 RepID=UPI00221F6E7D|nr:uncharacterized protein B0P05DRAFT_522815 [Gilbertella persicaria]KAI8097979.1 hypothetical protein B0P05DRAFT_522815 [Gilbertella persicaria]